MKKHIVVLDNSVTDLKNFEKILKDTYKVTLLLSNIQALNFLLENEPDLIIIDIYMSEENDHEVVKMIKGDNRLKEIPIIFSIDRIKMEDEMEALSIGAVDFIRKPFIPKLMLSRIKLQIEVREYRRELENRVKEKTGIIERLQDVIIFSLAELVECRDENTGGHVKRTAEYVKILTEEMMKFGVYQDILTKEYAEDIARSAPLHDVGKIGINDATLLKNGALDREEFEFMKQHTTLGASTLQNMIDETRGESFLYLAKDIAEYHHEKWDGTGYPKGLRGEDIPLCARIMAIGDVYDALTTKRPYKEPFTHDHAVEIILSGKEKNFDPKIIEIFEQVHYRFLEVKKKIKDRKTFDKKIYFKN